jgi:hypothetical protein
MAGKNSAAYLQKLAGVLDAFFLIIVCTIVVICQTPLHIPARRMCDHPALLPMRMLVVSNPFFQFLMPSNMIAFRDTQSM